MHIFILWILLRILTSILAAFVSEVKPGSPIETSVEILPASAPTAQWVDRTFLSPWLRWDAEWYQQIVTHGYSAMDGTAQFHPLYPWLATPLARAGLSPLLALMVITALAGLALFYSFLKLAQMDLVAKDAFFALLLFAFSPPAFVLFAPYPEALFLLFAVLCLFFARRGAWWLACTMGGLATLTRQQGIFLLIPVVWELWEQKKHQSNHLLKQWRDWLALFLIPAGYGIWIIYRAFFLSDWQINFSSAQDFIYSFFISPSATQVVQSQEFIWPWQALYFSLSKLVARPDIDLWVNISAGLAFLLLLGFAWKQMRTSYRLFALVITWISFSYYTGEIHPYMGLPRHLYLAFPVFIGLAGRIRKPWLRLLSVGISAITIAFFVVIYVTNTWVP